jgi:hypothetical protein
MSERRLAALVLKLWGLLWLISGLTSIPHVILIFASQPFVGEQHAMQSFSQWSTAIATACTFIVALVLLAAAERISARLFPDERVVLPSQLEQVAFGVLGAYLLILAARESAVILYVLATKSELDARGQFAYLWQENNGQALVGAIVQGAFGLVLLLGRQALSRAWLKLHPMGGGAGEG